MHKQKIIPRRLRFLLAESIGDSPVTLIHGPRQCGKTTLAKIMGKSLGYSYFTLDDADTRTVAQNDPMGFISDCPDQAILDEIQRVPELFRILKLSVDRHRKPGRFILTGSTNVLLVPELTDALVGRMEVLRLHPYRNRKLNKPKHNLSWKDCSRAIFKHARKSDWQRILLTGSSPVVIPQLSLDHPVIDVLLGTATMLPASFKKMCLTWLKFALLMQSPSCSQLPRICQDNSSTRRQWLQSCK